MSDPRIRKLAQVLVNYSVKVKPGELAVVRGTAAAEPLMLEVGREILKAGGQPQLLAEPSDWEAIFLKEASDEQLEFVSPILDPIFEKCDCLIRVKSPTNTKSLNNINPSRQSMQAKAMRPLMNRLRERFTSGEARWVLTLFPTHALAQDADMSLSEFEEFFYSATFVDLDDPVAAWQGVHDEQQRLVDWLVGKRELHAIGPHVDLKLAFEGRPFRNSDGDRNMPSGEIFTSPIEDSVNGWYRGSYPAFYRGQEVHGLELQFEGGAVVEAKADTNEAFLLEMLDVDEGSRRLGEFAIGTNKGIQRFTRNILFDEKIGGTMHVALGSSYADVGGLNRSSIHWDIITDMRDGGQVFVDGELFYESGEFKV